MARRIDIELTSARPDGTWTWRAAGAMQPRGVLDGQLLAAEARAGDVLRAEADFEIDGISIVSVMAPKHKKRSEPERIELLAPAPPATAVTTQLVGRGGRGPSEGRRSGRDEGRGGDGRRAPSGERTGRDGSPRTPTRRAGAESGRPSPSPSQGRTGGEGGGSSPTRSPGDRPSSGRPASSARPPSNRPEGDRRRRSEAGDTRATRDRGPSSGPHESVSRAAAGRRLNPGNVHRQAVLASLPPEQQPIAEQVLRGGIPAVRTAIHLEREKATAEGRSAPSADSLLAIAEELLPRLKAAEWRDRAEAAAKVADNLALRDLRSVVAGGDLARDDETRRLASTLRELLETRLTSMHEEWAQEIATQLREGRVVRALRVASRAPEATSRLSAEQAQELSAAASAAMSPASAPDLWLAVLEAVAASPVRRSVTPAGLPAEPGPALLSAAQQQVGRIPALAPLLGISMPPPPGPARPAGSRPPLPPRPQGPGRPPAPRPRLAAASPDPRATAAEGAAAAAVEPSVEPAVSVEPAAIEPAAIEPAAIEPAAAVEPSVEPAAAPEPSVEPTGRDAATTGPSSGQELPETFGGDVDSPEARSDADGDPAATVHADGDQTAGPPAAPVAAT